MHAFIQDRSPISNQLVPAFLRMKNVQLKENTSVIMTEDVRKDRNVVLTDVVTGFVFVSGIVK